MLAFFCFGARYRPWRYFAALHSRVFGDGAAPRRTRCSPQPCQHSVFRASGGGVLQVLPSAPFFCGEGGSYLVRGESRRSSMARSSRMRSRATGGGNILARCVLGGLADGKMFAKCVPQRPTAAGLRPDALLGDWRWQYSRAMRSRVSIRGNIPPRCVPGRPSVTIFSPHASQKRPRTGKSPVRGKIRAPCIRKAPQIAVGGYTARRSCQEGAAFAARAPRIMHGAQILPSAVAPNRPSARNPGAAEQREPPELDRSAQETQPGGSAPVASWAANTASSSRAAATALCQHQPVACRPGEQLCHRRQRLL